MSKLRTAIYCGWVTHRRLRPMRLHFAYRVFMFLLDLDELPYLDKWGGMLFGCNRQALFSFYNRDHGARDGSDLRQWVESALQQASIVITKPRIRILCFPRLFGYAFNPLSIIFCYDESDHLRAVLYEVKNTFGEQHTYMFPVADPSAPRLYNNCAKNFYVSPFIAMGGEYRFRLTPPGADFSLFIAQRIDEGNQLIASWAGQRHYWSSAMLRHCFFRYPLLTFKIIAAIHWQAIKLVIKGAHFYRRPPLPGKDISVHHGPSANSR